MPLNKEFQLKIKVLRKDLRKLNRIEGLEGLEQKLSELAAAGSGLQAVEVLKDAGRAARDTVLRRTPKGPTGNLRRAVFFSADQPFHDPKGPSVLVGVNKRIAPHALLHELGTSRQQPRPFFRPGIATAKPLVKRIVERGLKKIVEGLT